MLIENNNLILIIKLIKKISYYKTQKISNYNSLQMPLSLLKLIITNQLIINNKQINIIINKLIINHQLNNLIKNITNLVLKELIHLYLYNQSNH
jgi:hypothetical protein